VLIRENELEREVQRQLAAQDREFDWWSHKDFGDDLDWTRVGGGFLIQRRGRGSVAEVHVLSHAGLRFPAEFSQVLAESVDITTLASSIVRNRDSGTGCLARHLVQELESPSALNRLIAVFDVSRVLCDANRVLTAEQVVRDAYAGPIVLDESLAEAVGGHMAPSHSAEIRQRIRDELFHPWEAAVWQRIRTYGVRLVVNHHSFFYQARAQTVPRHESKPGQVRPHGQLFYRANELSQVPVLLDRPLVDSLVDTMQRRLAQLCSNPRVQVDEPLRAPAMPFLPDELIPTSPYSTVGLPHLTIAYEIRDDVLTGETVPEVVVPLINDFSAAVRDYTDSL
jgi:hypothetical protein